MKEVWVLTYHDLTHGSTILDVLASEEDVLEVVPGMAKLMNDVFGTIPNDDPGEPHREEGRISWTCLTARKFRVRGTTLGGQEKGES